MILLECPCVVYDVHGFCLFSSKVGGVSLGSGKFCKGSFDISVVDSARTVAQLLTQSLTII